MAEPLKKNEDEEETSLEGIRRLYPEFSALLAQLRDQIFARSDEARKNLDEQIMGSPGDEGDVSVVDLSADYFLRLSTNQRRELLEIRDAFDRMHRGVYGVCERGGEVISIPRLKKQPFARLCIDCQREIEKNSTVAFPRARPKF